MAPNASLLLIPDVVLISDMVNQPDSPMLAEVDVSFTVCFSMRLHKPSWQETTKGKGRARGIAFLVLPNGITEEPYATVSVAKLLALDAGGSLNLSSPITGRALLPGGGNVSVHVQIGRLPDGSMPLPEGREGVPVIHIAAIEPARSAARYTVWVEYSRCRQILSVFVAAGYGSPKPVTAIAVMPNVNYRDTAVFGKAPMGLFSSARQLVQIHLWSMDTEDFPNYDQQQWRKRVTLYSAVGSVSATVLVGAIVVCYYRSKYRRWKQEQERLAKTMQRLPGVPAQIEYAHIKKATINFHDTTKLGTGGFGAVYKCTLPPASSGRGQAMAVAVKKFIQKVEEKRYEDFLAEVSVINRLRHKNIVPLIGWSYYKGVPLLIYEYMEKGSLDQHLFQRGGTSGQGDGSFLQWETRYGIARDIATGLHYVHHEHEPMVLHRDIKASNIMLDSNFRARLGDFGIACTVSADMSHATGFVGTIGYIAPEYLGSNKATRQTDIYAFGLVILEIVTGKQHRDVPPDDGHLTYWVWRLHREGKILEAVDSVLTAGEVIADEAHRLLLLGLACTNPIPSNRPSMMEAVQVITKASQLPDVPLEMPSSVRTSAGWHSPLNSACSTAERNWDESDSSNLVTAST
nr:unnamed protein product [Digitaria exilis]